MLNEEQIRKILGHRGFASACSCRQGLPYDGSPRVEKEKGLLAVVCNDCGQIQYYDLEVLHCIAIRKNISF